MYYFEPFLQINFILGELKKLPIASLRFSNTLFFISESYLGFFIIWQMLETQLYQSPLEKILIDWNPSKK